MKTLITGGEGQLGRELVRQLGAQAVPLDLPAFDMTRRSAVRRVMRDLQPEAVINCAAYTLVDKAEQEPALCMTVNADAVAHLAEACREANCPLVQVSTDYVFGANERHTTPYTEEDQPAPQSVYARSKLAGEANAAAWEKHLIVRSCGLYGRSPRGNNFVETTPRLGAEKGRVRVVDDQTCSPHLCATLGQGDTVLAGPPRRTRTDHVVNSGSATWCEFAAEIFRQAKMPVRLEPITTREYGALAPRPRYSMLSTAKYAVLHGPDLPPWPAALQEYLATRPSRLERLIRLHTTDTTCDGDGCTI